MRAVWTLAIKDLRLLVRDRVSLFWVLAFPLLLALFFGSMFGGDEGERAAMKVVAFDESGGAAQAFLARLGESDAIEIDTAPSLQEARDRVRRGERVAFVHVRPDFSDGSLAMFGRPADARAPVALGVDPARTAERGLLQGLVTQALFSGMTESLGDPSRMLDQTRKVRAQLADAPELAPQRRRSLETLMDALDQVSRSNDPSEPASEDAGGAVPMGEALVESVPVDRDRSGKPRSPYEVTFPSSIVWGLMGCATAFATTLVRERRAGTMFRLRVSPLSLAHVLAGKGLACMLAGLGASAVLLAIGVIALGVRVVDPLLLGLSLVAASACFCGLMMVMSVLGRTESAVAGGSWVVMMPLAMIGGGMIPLIAMPPWLLTASNASPFKWAIFAIEGAVWRDLTLAEVLPSLLVLLAIAVGLFALGVTILRRREG